MVSMSDIRKDQENKGRRWDAQRAVSLLRAVLIGAAMALVWGVLSSLLRLESRFPAPAAQQLFDRPVMIQVTLYGIVSPVLEELLFRRILFDLVRRIAPELVSAVIVSALFALWHGNIVQMLYAFPAGMILQALRSASGRMEEPVLCHMGANLTAIAVTALLGNH